MISKYNVVVIAYRNIEKRIIDKISVHSVTDIKTLNDLDTISTYCGKGFNMNDRLCIYLGWFKERIIEKIKGGYEVSILELPARVSKNTIDIIEFLDDAYEGDLIILEKVAV